MSNMQKTITGDPVRLWLGNLFRVCWLTRKMNWRAEVFPGCVLRIRHNNFMRPTSWMWLRRTTSYCYSNAAIICATYTDVPTTQVLYLRVRLSIPYHLYLVLYSQYVCVHILIQTKASRNLIAMSQTCRITNSLEDKRISSYPLSNINFKTKLVLVLEKHAGLVAYIPR